MVPILKVGAILLILKTNTLFFVRPGLDLIRPDKPKEINNPVGSSAPAVFHGGKSSKRNNQQILGYGKEPRGPHIWVVTGKFQFSLSPRETINNQNSEKNLVRLRFICELFLYVKRTMEFNQWQRYSGQNYSLPIWANHQLKLKKNLEEISDNGSEISQKQLANNFLYQLPILRGTLVLGAQDIKVFANLKSIQEKSDLAEKDIILNWSHLQQEEKKFLLRLFKERIQNHVRSKWNSAGLFLFFTGKPFKGKGIYIFLGDYSFRNIAGNVIALDSTAENRKIQFLRLKANRIQLTIISEEALNSNPRDLKFKINITDLKDKEMISEELFPDKIEKLKPKLITLGEKNIFIQLGERKWLLNHDGNIIWFSHQRKHFGQILKGIAIPENKGLLYFESEDRLGLDPQSEKLILFKFYVDKYEIGRSKPSIGSRNKEFRYFLEPGKHVLSVERWELIGDAYKKVRKILQPKPVYIMVPKNGIAWIELIYNKGEKPQIFQKNF